MIGFWRFPRGRTGITAARLARTARKGRSRSPLCSRPLRWLGVDALARTRELLDKGDPIDEVVRELRAEGFSMMESMSALIKAGSLSFDDAKPAVVDGSVWADP